MLLTSSHCEIAADFGGGYGEAFTGASEYVRLISIDHDCSYRYTYVFPSSGKTSLISSIIIRMFIGFNPRKIDSQNGMMGTFYGTPLYLGIKTMDFYRFSLEPIHLYKGLIPRGT